MSSAIGYRLCVEFMPPEEVAHPRVVALLTSRGIAPMLAAQADGDDEAAARACAPYVAAGLAPALWPLLPDADGYWPSTANAAQFAVRVRAVLDAAERVNVRVPWIAVDLEPRVDETLALRRGAVLDAVRQGARALFRGPSRYASASATYRALADEVRLRGARTLAIAYPFVAGDSQGGEALQARCEAPLDIGWDRVSVMTYGSLLSGYSRRLLSPASARWYAYEVYQRLARRYGAVGSFVGIVGHGKLGDERAYTDPKELEADAACARAAGVVEINGYSLEGILDSAHPEAWLDALVTPRTAKPRFSLRGAAMHAGVVAAGQILR